MMKKITSIAIISLLAFSILSALVPLTVAAATLKLSPTSGAPGTTVTVTVTGPGFNAGEDVQIYFDTTLIKTVKADGDGGISTTFNVPAVAYGIHTVRAVGVSSGSEATAPFYVTRLTLSQTSGHVGTLLTVEGWGFNATQYARVYFDIDADGTMDPDEIMAIAPVDANGHFLTSFTVPEAANGTHTVEAVKSSTPGLSGENTYWYASATFTVQPRIWLSPISGPSGLTVKVYGNGFSASASNMTIFFDKDKDGVMDPDENLPKNPKTLGTTGTGTFADTGCFTFVVPTVAYDTYTVWVNDTNGVKASTTFTVGPASITLTPDTGIVGAHIGITGVGFTPGMTIDVCIDKTSVTWVGGAPTVGTDGTFSGTFKVPPLAKGPGAYTVNATDRSVWATAAFTIPAPSITLNATQLPPGGALRITGTNFGNYSEGYTVKIYFNTSEQTPAVISVDKYGNVDANLTIPTDAGLIVYVVNVTISGYSQFNATKILTVPQAYITLSASSGTPGTTITVNGYWFQEGQAVSAKYDNTPLTLTPLSPTVQPDGRFTASFTVPSILPGPYTITVTAGTTTATETFTVISSDTQTILSSIEELEKKLDNVLGNLTSTSFGLSAIKTVVDDINSKLDNLATEISSISGKLGSYNPGDTVASLLYSIKDKLDALPAWGNLVTKNWADLTGYIDSAKADIIAAMPELPPLDLSPVLTAIQGNSTAILGAIDSAKADIIAKLGTFTGTDTVASLLYEIEAKIEAGRAAQAASGSGAISVSAPIYTGTKVGTVTVSMSTSGIGVGESVAIRYYIDPANPTLYVQKTIVTNTNTLGWTDTAAAWKVEVVITGTGAVNYAYSIIYPP